MIFLEKLVHVTCFFLVLTSCSSINEKLGQKDDWWGEELAEELVEDVINYETGYKPNIDFTPGSPEK